MLYDSRCIISQFVTHICLLNHFSLLASPNQNSEIAMETKLLAGGNFDIGAHCPRLLRKTMHLDPDRDEYMDRWFQPGSIGKYGEWFWFR